MSPVLSIILPGADPAALAALADTEGVLWNGHDDHPGRDRECFSAFVGFLCLVGPAVRDHSALRDLWCGPGPAPSLRAIEALSTAYTPATSVRLAAACFANLIGLEGAALARALPVFIEPVLQLFRRAVAYRPELRPVDRWMRRLNWDAILYGARDRDLAAWAVYAGAAVVEGQGPDAVIRLRSGS